MRDDVYAPPCDLGQLARCKGVYPRHVDSNLAVLFLLPEVAFSSINRDNFNYAPVAVGVVLLFSGGYWLLSARKWFTGPKVQGSEAELIKIEGEFANIERELAEVD